MESTSSRSLPNPTQLEKLKDGDVVTRRAFARKWRIGMSTLERLEREGLPRVELSPRCIRIAVRQADAWLLRFTNHRRKGVSP